ncbi:hypothetical protein [Streptomyces massasporeus]|uniref:hypothetical protein n=1 Tax=Streptomyces massasporeus TaxID=67324 RepID=UPI0036CDDBCB
MDLLQGCDDEELQAEALEVVQGEADEFLRASTEGFADDGKPEGAAAAAGDIQFEPVGEGGGQDGVGELLLWPPDLPPDSK